MRIRNLFFKSFPFYKQYDSNDCGPTSIKIICSFYKKPISIQVLRNLCNIDREGVSIKALNNTCEKIGFTSKAIKFTVKKENDNIPSLEELPLPAIAYWNANHFVVIYKVASNKVYLSDPARGKTSLSIRDARKFLYTNNNYGKIILLEPNNYFYNSNNQYVANHNISKKKNFITTHLLKSKSSFKYLFLLIFGQLIFQSITPFLTQETFDKGIIGKNSNVLLWILCIQIFIFLFSSLISYLQSIISNKVAESINQSLINQFVKKIFKLPLNYYHQKKSSDFLQRIQDLNRIESFLVYNFSSMFVTFLGFIVMTIIAIYYSLSIFSMFILYNTVYGIWMYFILRKKRALDYEQYDIGIFRHRSLVEMIHGYQEIKLGGNETPKIKAFINNQRKFFLNSLKKIKISQSLSVGGGFIKQIGYGYITFYTGLLTIQNHITLGEMAAIQLVISQLDQMLSNMLSTTSIVQDVVFSIERVLDVQSLPEEEYGNKVVDNNWTITLNSINFSYNAVSNKVLNNINLTIEQGKTTAIVGASGSGKTTLLKVALGLCEPTSGNILLNNKPMKEFDISSWRKKCGVVLQDGYIFTDTIINNITQSESDTQIDFKRYINALKLAELYDFVETLPIKHQTKIGNEGLALSSGQHQRLLIARLIYKNPEYIFMDEATNSLDSQTENRVVNNINSHFKNKTKIVIAHRLSTVKNADKIIVMENGKIIEYGSHNKLINLEGSYFNLVKEQLQLA